MSKIFNLFYRHINNFIYFFHTKCNKYLNIFKYTHTLIHIKYIFAYFFSYSPHAYRLLVRSLSRTHFFFSFSVFFAHPIPYIYKPALYCCCCFYTWGIFSLCIFFYTSYLSLVFLFFFLYFTYYSLFFFFYILSILLHMYITLFYFFFTLLFCIYSLCCIFCNIYFRGRYKRRRKV